MGVCQPPERDQANGDHLKQLVASPPPHPCLPLTKLLDTISRWYPDIFYKVLISCAVSPKESAVGYHLSIIAAISKFFPDFWLRDVGMITTVLMLDVGGQGKGKSTSTVELVWGKARLGQSTLLLELIGWIQTLRHSIEASGVRQISSFLRADFNAIRLEIKFKFCGRAEVCQHPGKSTRHSA